MTGSGSRALTIIEFLVVLACVLAGWFVVVNQVRDPAAPASGTAWLVVLALVGTAGAVLWWRTQRSGPTWWAVLSLMLVALSPTVFLYPLSVLAVVLACVESVRVWRRRASYVGRVPPDRTTTVKFTS